MRKPIHPARRAFQIPAEWITFGISALLIAALVGLVLLSWKTQSSEPPTFNIQAGAVQPVKGQFYVPFTIENTGGGTAEAVQVIGELRRDGQVIESGEQQIDFLSSREQSQGVFIFSENPQMGSLSLRAASYSLP